MPILLLAEHDGATLSEQTAKAMTAARQISDDVHVLVAGDNVRAIAEQAASLDGVARVLLADASFLANMVAEPLAALILSLSDSYETIVAPATANGKNVLPRVAALLDTMQISDIVEVVAPDTFKRPVYAGNAIQTVQNNQARTVVTVRTSAFRAVGNGGRAIIEMVSVPADPGLSRFVSAVMSKGDRPKLSAARIVVSGGRALGSAEQFEQLITALAERLGAAVGASRAAVDAGYAPNDWQVGQTGQVVAPDLYIACGISGAIQHLAGMKESKVIVAINKDADAPIFKVADYGLVGDIFELLPALRDAV